jgi:hypothetical protein
MKLTTKKLRQIIAEEIKNLSESVGMSPWDHMTQQHSQLHQAQGDVYIVMMSADNCLEVEAVYKDLKNAQAKRAQLESELEGNEPVGYKIVPMNFADGEVV